MGNFVTVEMGNLVKILKMRKMFLCNMQKNRGPLSQSPVRNSVSDYLWKSFFT